MWIQTNDNGYCTYCGENEQPHSVEYLGEIPEDFYTNFPWYKLVEGVLSLDTEAKSKADTQAATIDRILFLKDYLNNTDYNCEKILEGLFSVMTSSTALNLVPNLLTYISSIKDEYTQVFAERQAAREEINELEN